MVKFLSRSGSRSDHGEVKLKKSLKNAKNQYIGVFEGGDHESGLNSDVSRLRSRSGQGHGKVKLKKHHVAGKWLQILCFFFLAFLHDLDLDLDTSLLSPDS